MRKKNQLSKVSVGVNLSLDIGCNLYSLAG